MTKKLFSLVFKIHLKRRAENRAATKPTRYKAIKTMPFKLKMPQETSGTTKAINKVYTGSRAEQLIKGTTMMVMRRSFQWSIVRVAITAGMAHATPDISGTMLRPFKPKGRINRSVMKTTRAM